jgi:hypothetical protein
MTVEELLRDILETLWHGHDQLGRELLGSRYKPGRWRELEADEPVIVEAKENSPKHHEV